jgi:Secretion system C-terminal sorting domain
MKKNYFLTLVTISLLILSKLTNAQVIATLGSGTNVHSTTAGGPINEFYRSSHCQIVYTAAEINAAGVFGGSMLKLGFYVTGAVINPLPNFAVKIKHTTATNVAIYDGVGLTTFYSTPSYNPPAGGFNMLTLSTPFSWNGVDNILIDVCFDQVSAYTSSGVVRIYNPTVPNGFIYVRSDIAPQCGVAASTITNEKPQIQFEFTPPAPFDLGVSAFMKPLASKKCFGNDTIIARLKNYGTAVADFTATPAVLTVKTTGPIVSTFTLAVTTGTLASSATQDFTLTTSFNMSTLGVYKFKGYTTAVGDGSPLNDTTNLTVTKSPFFTTTTLPNDSVCLGVPVQLTSFYDPSKQVGNGTVTNAFFQYPAPYGNYNGGAKNQFLFTAAELTAAGITAGNITSMALDATNLNGTDPLAGFQISMGTTTVTSLTQFQTGLTSCFTTPSYTPALGINTHIFSSAFNWNGTDNVIVETCFNNNTTSSSNVSFNSTIMPFSASVWYNASFDPSVCSSTISNSFSNQRPNMYFRQPVVVNYSWLPALGLSSASISNPIANNSITKTYTVTANIAGCTSYDTVRIFIKPTPTPNLGNDTTVCSLPFVLSANTTANSFLWNTGSIGSSLNIVTTGKYWVRGTNSNGCQKTDTVNIKLSTLPIVTLGPDTGFCQGSFIHLYAGNVGCTYSWTPGGATTSSITVSNVGTYSVVATNTAGCKASDVVNVVLKTKPTVGLIFGAQTRFCPTESNRPLLEGTPSGGTYIGAGITGNIFNANQAGQGTYVIIYNYTGPNGCSNIAKDTLFVNACVGLDELTNDVSLNVYPNPNTGIFTLELNTANAIDATVTIMSIDSKIVYSEKVSGSGIISQSININDLANGIYYLQVTTKDAIKTYKVLKQ